MVRLFNNKSKLSTQQKRNSLLINELRFSFVYTLYLVFATKCAIFAVGIQPPIWLFQRLLFNPYLILGMKKKVFLFAFCLLGICTISAQWSIKELEIILSEIILSEIILIEPLDDSKNTEQGGRPDPTQFRATQDGSTITATADTGELADVMVTNNANGTTVANQEFIGATMLSIPVSGSYTITIQSAGTAVQGQFTIK